MFFNLSPQVVALGFASVTSILVYTDKLENNIGLNTFRDRVFTIEKLTILNGENAIILVFLQYLSQFV